jgi:hypothetical protein
MWRDLLAAGAHGVQEGGIEPVVDCPGARLVSVELADDRSD